MFIIHSLFLAQQSNAGQGLLILFRFLDHIQRKAIVGRTSLEQRSASRRDLYFVGIQTRNFGNLADVDTRLIPLGHWDRVHSLSYPYWLIYLTLRQAQTLFVNCCAVYFTGHVSWVSPEPYSQSAEHDTKKPTFRLGIKFLKHSLRIAEIQRKTKRIVIGKFMTADIE